jgi:hypothetical protein
MDMVEEKLDEQQLGKMSTGQLVRHALEEARLLAKAEVLHAKQELRDELQAAKAAGILIGAGAALALCGLSVLLVALALALPLPAALSALLVGVLVLGGAAAAVLFGLKSLPKRPLEKTQERMKRDLAIAKEELG